MSISDFEILSKLGDGAFSSVFKVMRKSDGQLYALKKVKLGALKQKEKENALNEVRILASVSHPNIIAYKEAFFDEPTSTLCIVMELAEGGDLLKKISTHKSSRTFFSENEVWTCLVHVSQGLKVLHDSKILHRDLKCANIFISKDGCMKLGDLNVSKVNKRGLAYTQTGTPYYASPEVWKDQPYNSSSDIWSLGCVIYEMAALVPPFTATDMQGLYKKIIRGVYPNIPSQYSSDLSDVIRTLLQVNPTLRPTCDKILEMPPVQRHIHIQPLQNPAADLLGTIKFEPGNNLKQKLPGPNYDSRNRGMSAHANRPKPEDQPAVRVASAKGARGEVPRSQVKDRYDGNNIQAVNDYRPQVKEQPRYPVKNEVYEPVNRKPAPANAPIGDLYRIPEVKADYNPYNAPYRPEKYNPVFAEPKAVKVPSNENLYKPPSRENLNYLRNGVPDYNKPDNVAAYLNKPASRDNKAYVPQTGASPKVPPSYVAPPSRENRPTPSYLDKREAPPSRDNKAAPSYMDKREAPPSRENRAAPSYMDKREAPPSRDNRAAPSYMDKREAPPSRENRAAPSYMDKREAPPSRENRAAPSYMDKREAPPSRENRAAPSYIDKREAPPSRENRVAPSYIDKREAPPSRDKPLYQDYRVPSREIQSRDKYSNLYNAPPSREKPAVPYSPSYQNAAARGPYAPVRETNSREAQRAPPSRGALPSREARPGSREAENKNFNRIGAMVLQSPKQLVPKAMPSPVINQAVKVQYGQDKRGQRVNPVWWG